MTNITEIGWSTVAISSLGETLRGTSVALVTPLNAGGRLDEPGLERLVNRVVAGGVRAVCPVGSTGEGQRLTLEQRVEVVDAVAKLLPPDVAMVPAGVDVNVDARVAELALLAGHGAAGVLVAPPGQYPLADDEVLRYYLSLADESPVPLVLYNFPAMTKSRIAPPVAGQLAEHDNVVAIKDSSRDLEYFQAVLYATSDATDFAVLTGTDTMLLASMHLGGHGAIAASANLVPRLGRDLYDAANDQQWDVARALQKRLFEIVVEVRRVGVPAGWKAALEVVGVCEGCPAQPESRLPPHVLGSLAERLSALNVD